MRYFIDFSLLKKNRDYRLLYIGQFISFIGTMITGVALPFQIYQITHSTIQVGMLSIVQLLPLLITALIGGVFADRHNRKRLLLGSELLLVLGTLGLIGNASATSPSVTVIYILAFFMSAMTGIHRPAFDGISQQLVEPEDYKTLGALMSFKYSFCAIAGPSLAGLLIAYYGVAITYLLDSLTFFVSLLCLWLMHQIPKPVSSTHDTPSIFLSLKQGLQFAFQRQELLGSYLVDIFAMICAIPNALFPAMAMGLGGPKVLGLLYAAPAIGALFLSFFSSWTTRIVRDGRAIAISAALWGLSMMGFGLANALWVAVFFLILSGAFDAASGIFRTALWNETIPIAYRGRLAGIEMISYLCGPKLGDARAGLMAASIGMTTSIVLGGAMCIISVAICCAYMPKFWNYKTHRES